MKMQLNHLPSSFYSGKTIEVAKALLGKCLVHRVAGIERIGKIVEVEAYLGGHDLASHSAKGLTKRTEVMFGPPGHAYVYLIYGMYHCMNVVTEPEGQGCAVLIRALEPVANLEGRTQGPGLLCQAMGIDRSLNRKDLTSQDFFISDDKTLKKPLKIIEKPRVGVNYAGEWANKPLRFYIKGNPFVSRP